MSDDSVIGEIRAVDDLRKRFTVIAGDARRTPRTNAFAMSKSDERVNVARPCEHGRFLLDEQWRTVTCEMCSQQIDAYAALRFYVAAWDQLIQVQQRAEEAELRAVMEQIRRIARLKTTPEAWRDRLVAALNRPFQVTLPEARKLLIDALKARGEL